jgi:hypothetical protein
MDDIEKRNAEFEQNYQPLKDIKNAKDVPELADALADYLLDMYGDEIESEQLDVDVAWLVAERGMSNEDAALFTRLVYDAIGLDRIQFTREN